MRREYFVISEVVPVDPTNLSDGFKFPSDDNWVDSTYVIDGDRLRYGIPRGDRFFNGGWWNGSQTYYANSSVRLILDPPKLEGDEWQKDLKEVVHMITDVLHSLLQRMPRKP